MADEKEYGNPTQFRKEFASIHLQLCVTTKMGRSDGGKRKGGNQNRIEGES